MNRRTSLPFVAAFVGLLCLGFAKKEKFTITFHLEVDHRPQGKNSVFSDRVGNPPKDVLFSLVPIIDHTDFAAFRPFAAEDGSKGALIQLNHAATRRLMTVSASKHGAYIRTLVNGRPVDYLVIDEQITDGKIVIWSGLTDEVLALLEKKCPKM